MLLQIICQVFGAVARDNRFTTDSRSDNLSRLITDSRSDITPIDDYFPDEYLFFVSTMPWFANIVNFFCFRTFASSLEYPRQNKVLEQSEELLLG